VFLKSPTGKSAGSVEGHKTTRALTGALKELTDTFEEQDTTRESIGTVKGWEIHEKNRLALLKARGQLEKKPNENIKGQSVDLRG
jgi:hypothetical protein